MDVEKKIIVAKVMEEVRKHETDCAERWKAVDKRFDETNENTRFWAVVKYRCFIIDGGNYFNARDDFQQLAAMLQPFMRVGQLLSNNQPPPTERFLPNPR